MPLHKALFVETSPAPVKYAAELLGHRSAKSACRWSHPPTPPEAVRDAMVHAGLMN